MSESDDGHPWYMPDGCRLVNTQSSHTPTTNEWGFPTRPWGPTTDANERPTDVFSNLQNSTFIGPTWRSEQDENNSRYYEVFMGLKVMGDDHGSDFGGLFTVEHSWPLGSRGLHTVSVQGGVHFVDIDDVYLDNTFLPIPDWGSAVGDIYVSEPWFGAKYTFDTDLVDVSVGVHFDSEGDRLMTIGVSY